MKRSLCLLALLGISGLGLPNHARAQDAVIDASEYPPKVEVEGQPIDVDRDAWEDGWEYEFPAGHPYEEVEAGYDPLQGEWEYEFETRGTPGPQPRVLLDEQPIGLEYDWWEDEWEYKFPAHSAYEELEVEYEPIEGQWEYDFEPRSRYLQNWRTDDPGFDAWYGDAWFE